MHTKQDEWICNRNTCYDFNVQSTRSWSEARLFCNQKGSRLAELESRATMDKFVFLMTNKVEGLDFIQLMAHNIFLGIKLSAYNTSASA